MCRLIYEHFTEFEEFRSCWNCTMWYLHFYSLLLSLYDLANTKFLVKNTTLPPDQDNFRLYMNYFVTHCVARSVDSLFISPLPPSAPELSLTLNHYHSSHLSLAFEVSTAKKNWPLYEVQLPEHLLRYCCALPLIRSLPKCKGMWC